MWRLKVSERSSPWLRSMNNLLGRQEWVFHPELGTPDERAEVEKARQEFAEHRFERKHSSDLIMRIQYAKENPHVKLTDSPAVKLGEHEDLTEEAVWTSVKRAVSRVCNLQAHDGHWPADYGGLLFLLPGLLITLYVTGVMNTVLSSEHQKEMRRYIYNHQNEDGGWGLHIEGHSTMLGSVLNYVALRLLGEGPSGGEDGAMEKGRNWILNHGGATSTASWGKFWLSVLGVYDWSGNNPVPPEFWLLPYFLPFHPGRMSCYCRMVYLPMSYIYGKRFVGPVTSLVLELRNELYKDTYDGIDWNKARTECAKEDMYSPHSLVQGMSWAFLHKFVEPIMFHWPGRKLREKALAMAIRHVHYEDECTHYINLGAVPKIYDGSQVWDAGFTVEALLATGLIKELGPTLKRAHAFLKNSQLLENFPGDLNYWYRHISKGGWTFTTADDGWLVSDCTGTALKACLLLSNISPKFVGEPMEIDRQYDGINCLMSFMNDNGGFRHLNSYGSWGVCFTYGTWFAVAGLVCAGRTFTNSATIRKACDFLLSKELPSGGWGESHLSAHIVVYTNLKGNRPHGTHTAWAVLALLDAGQAEIDPALLHRGARVLLNLQLEDGEFPHELMDLNAIKRLLLSERPSHDYIAGVKGFLKFAYNGKRSDAKIRCPCVKCVNRQLQKEEIVYEHLVCNGMLRGYTIWGCHGETASYISANKGSQSQGLNINTSMRQVVQEAFGYVDNELPTNEPNEPCSSKSEPDAETQAFFDLLREADVPLCEGCGLSKLSFLVLLFHVKSINKWSNKSLNDLLGILQLALPNGSSIPRTFVEARKIIAKLGLRYEKIHICPNNCQLYRKEKKDDDFCSKCGASRWKNKADKTTLTKKERRKAVPNKVLRYFPIKPRLKRLFMNRKTAKLPRWHDEERMKDGALRHPADSEVWKAIDSRYPDFAADSRNMRFGIATDGFNPYGKCNSSHSCWPVVLVPYNFPPWLCMKTSSLMLTLIIPGYPGKDFHTFMEPVYDELNELFEVGMPTYDASRDEKFQLRAISLCTVSDYPGSGILAQFSVNGQLGCMSCEDETTSIRLTHGLKQCFWGHRRWLPTDHEFRYDSDSFDGTEEHRSKPVPCSGASLLENKIN